MATAVHPEATFDTTEVPQIVRGAIVLGLVQAATVFATSLSNRFLTGALDHALTGIFVAIGLSITVFWPGVRTKARTIEGIAGAAGIGIGSAFAFLILDVVVLQPLGTWTNRWYEIGGHSNWWYHPVWWMLSAYLAWFGAWVLANQATRKGESSVPGAIIYIGGLAAMFGAGATLLGFPGAGWNVPTFAVAVMPALALGVVIGLIGNRRG